MNLSHLETTGKQLKVAFEEISTTERIHSELEECEKDKDCLYERLGYEVRIYGEWLEYEESKKQPTGEKIYFSFILDQFRSSAFIIFFFL
jgi:hypothetical protein